MKRQIFAFAILLTKTPFIAVITFYKLLKNLKHDVTNTSKWFKVNSMKANSKKFMILGKGTRRTVIHK